MSLLLDILSYGAAWTLFLFVCVLYLLLWSRTRGESPAELIDLDQEREARRRLYPHNAFSVHDFNGRETR